MRSLLSGGRHVAADSIEDALGAFEAACEAGRSSLARFWSGYGPGKTTSTLAALVKLDLQRRFERGERPKVIEYLGKFPILADNGDRVVSLVYEEFCLLKESGEDPDSREFCEDYGPWRESLRSQLAYHRELSQAVGADPSSVKYPDLGERFEKYRLHSILGKGGVARVYLATEEGLGDRQVAIKVSASFGQEPCILAKLDHRNIVPILTVAESESGLRGICMPYRPGSTLEELIRKIGRGVPPRSARAISEALRPRDPRVEVAPEEQRVGWVGFPIDRTFPEAVAWIGLCLAHALSYLHKQGVFHRDIKPANILLAYREGPQLLDFNLAQDPSRPEGAAVAQKGGTLPYMAPEQLRAFLDHSMWDGVGPAADLYSLGLVLRELLTGRAPEVPASRGSLPREICALLDRRTVPAEPIREINPAVPPALESIVEKCLAFAPSRRYESAADLATDLRRFIDRRPLEHAPNPSKVERGINWIHRNRQVLVASVFIALSSSIAYAFLPVPSASAPDDLSKAERLLDSGREEDLVLAKREFERLCEERPNLAAPPIGLAIALDRLGDKRTEYISELFKAANGKPGAEEVYHRRLDREPASTALLRNLGIVLASKGHFERARKILDQCLRIEPEGIANICALAELDRQTLGNETAIRGITRAIEIGRRDRVGSRRLYDLRKINFRLHLQLADERVDGEASADRRGEASRLLAVMEANWNAMQEDWDRITDVRGVEEHSFTRPFFEGCLLSIRAVAEADSGEPDRSNRHFDEAFVAFEKAKGAISEDNPQKLRRRHDVEEQEGRLKVRRRAFGAP